FDRAFGAGAPPDARMIGAGLKPRLVFGWPALIEKLLCRDLGLDDVFLEALKLATIASGAIPELDPALDLRLAGERDGALLLQLVDPVDGRPSGEVAVPHAAYAVVTARGEAWAPAIAKLAGRMFVDIGRVLHPQA